MDSNALDVLRSRVMEQVKFGSKTKEKHVNAHLNALLHVI